VREIHAEAFIRDDASPDSIELCGFDPSIQVANLGSRFDTHISMGHEGLKDNMLPEMHQCVLLEVPLALLTMVLNHVEHVLSVTSHVTNIVRPKIVPIQQLISEPTIVGLLCGLYDCGGIVGEENLIELLLLGGAQVGSCQFVFGTKI